jgi:hypothetical protein
VPLCPATNPQELQICSRGVSLTRDFRRAAKRQKKREMLDAYEERMQKMREFESEVAFTGSDASEDDDDDDDDDDDGTRGERGAGSVAAAHGPSKMTFGDREEGTASVVEVEEMDLSSLSRQSVSATLLPALPPAEGPMSKRLKKKIKGPQRRCAARPLWTRGRCCAL